MTHNPESAGAVRGQPAQSADQQTGRQHLSGDQSAEQVKAHLTQARDLLRNKNNWGQSGGKSGPHCIQTAISRVCGGLIEVDRPALEVMAQALGLGAYKSAAQIWDWNDAPGRTHAEVLKAFDDAIALAEGRDR